MPITPKNYGSVQKLDARFLLFRRAKRRARGFEFPAQTELISNTLPDCFLYADIVGMVLRPIAKRDGWRYDERLL